jgi:succinate dehydrogenase/fumarate reductase cytochrome b subunit
MQFLGPYVWLQVLGREYYQTSFGEKYLVLAPLAIHSLSGLAKRLLSSTGGNHHHHHHHPPTRPLTSMLSLTGYASMFIFVPIHFLTHRYYPMSRHLPSSVSAELDYEFVKLGLATWPWRSWALYAGLVAVVALHASEGLYVVFNGWLKVVLGGMKTRRPRRMAVAFGGIVAPVLSGLYVISNESLMTFSSLAIRFQDAFTQSFIYRI